MLSRQLLAILSVAGLVAAAPQVPAPGSADCPLTICLDGINPDCGIRWGGCYDMCQPSLSPTMPPCPSKTKSRTRKTRSKPTKTRSVSPTFPTPTTMPTISDCVSRTVCVDYVNECSMWYGGCHNDCRPWPSYTPPPCPSTSPVVTPVQPTA